MNTTNNWNSIIMKKMMRKTLSAKKSWWQALLVASSLISLVSCGGGSGLGYKETDPVDRAPYFSVAGSAVENGSSLDASKLKPMNIEFFDDKSLKSYYVSVDNAVVAEGELSGDHAVVEVPLDDFAGGQTYSAKVVATDSAGGSTIAHFTLNVKAYYEQLSLVGSATPGGWDTSMASAMTVDENNPAIFTWSGPLSAGEFKISTQQMVSWDAGYDWIHPLSQGQSLTNMDYDIVVSGGMDNKWVVPEGEAGDYRITINQKDKTIFIGKPLAAIYIVGSATPIGWNLGNAVAFERDANDPAVFSLTVVLAAGEFKFASQTASWEVGDWLYAPGANASLPTASGTYDLRVAGAPDNKWMVSASEAGTYQFTIDLDAGSIVAVKQ